MSLRLICILISLIVIIGSQPSYSVRLPKTVVIKGEGWSGVSRRWPLNESGEFFIASKKGHHFIEFQEINKLLPLQSDLRVSLEFYYRYAKIKPIIDISACRNSTIVTAEDSRWQTHSQIVRKTDCNRSKKLVYHIILQDEGDVFAWKKITIEPHTDTVTEAPQTSQGPVAPTDASSSAVTAEPSSSSNNQGTEATTGDGSNAGVNPDATASDPSSSSNNQRTEATTGDGSNAGAAAVPGSSNDSKETIDSETRSSSQQAPDGSEKNRRKRDSFSEDNASQNDESLGRFKRSPRVVQTYVCRPKACDRKAFRIDRFLPLLNGVPELPTGVRIGGKEPVYFLATNKEPLKIKITENMDLSDVDTCINLMLFMDKGTKLDFTLEVNGSSRSLEQIERKQSDASAGKWTVFERCLSNYMPRLGPNGSGVHEIAFKFARIDSDMSKHVAILIDKQTNATLRNPYPILSYLKNAPSLESISNVSDIWLVDRFGQSGGAKFEMVPNPAGGRKLRVINIDRKLESFNLTSRWMKTADLEQNPVHFIYQVNKADWIKAVNFTFETVGESVFEVTHNLYTAQQAGPPATSATSNQPSSESSSQPPVATSNSDSINQQISDLIRFRNRDESKEFRFHIEHFVKDEVRQAQASGSNEGLSLDITRLAYGDLCAGNVDYCHNNGTCKPLGPGEAECHCLPGYAGDNCQLSRPCEMLYGNLTGYELCTLAKAKCVEDASVTELRCIWEEDRYFNCAPLFGPGGQSGTTPASTTEGPGGSTTESPTGSTSENPTIPTTEGPSTSETVSPPPGNVTCSDGVEQLNLLRDQLNASAQKVIILTVFLVSVTIFLLVIICSMVSRLMKSKRRLKSAQNDVHELSRPRPQTASASNFARVATETTRQRPGSGIFYNNQAFDAA